MEGGGRLRPAWLDLLHRLQPSSECVQWERTKPAIGEFEMPSHLLGRGEVCVLPDQLRVVPPSTTTDRRLRPLADPVEHVTSHPRIHIRPSMTGAAHYGRESSLTRVASVR
ncbi:hypothetical protein WOLCODRAFT_141394 [Wolfiporia cocos MD-104 SS10]|uniref:Uncharacterized protein n=1 Tax=Wolfiporia cocos (strain MD-104) TaxID=742152 RepID=A0A2H3J3C3_WOLCO|nr:hypothetical protein WOLCODRAFT_141394 [Wolfiporia cocos MD-104 SS10]